MDKSVNGWTVIVRRGNDINVTLATIYYDRWGVKTQQPVIIVDNWKQGADTALQQGYKSALFVDSGTVFTDWPAWQNHLNNYPHKGMIAHIIMHPGENIRIDPQCWFMDLDIEFNDDDLVSYPMPLRSDKNLHDNYTPLWAAPGDKIICHKVDGFGQTLIAQQLDRGRPIANWNPISRDIKRFRYDQSRSDLFRDYVNLAENQFWIFNNEPIKIANKEKIICPGSGLFWIFNIVSDNTRHIDIVDISDVQIRFCHDIWQHWDGIDYGSFVVDFIARHNIEHYELDRGDLNQLDRLKLKNKCLLKQYVNDQFRYFLGEMGFDGDSFRSRWQHCQSIKGMTAQKGNLVDWIIKVHDMGKQDHVWASNILDYKWTLLHTTAEKTDRCRDILK